MDDNYLTPRKILIVAQRPSDYVEMRRCAIALSKIGWAIQVLYFCHNPLTKEELDLIVDIENLQNQGVISDKELFGYSSNDTLVSDNSKRSLTDKIIYYLYKHNKWILKSEIVLRFIVHIIVITKRALVEVASFFLVISIYFNKPKLIIEIINKLQPDAVIFPEDVVGTVTPLVIKAGHLCNIPSIIVPYTIANQEEAFRSLSNNPNYQYSFWPNHIIGFFFRRWIMKKDGKSLVRLPAPYILGQELTRTAPPDPWMMNSGYINAIAVENEKMLDYYLAAGLPRSKLKVVGAFYDDYLARFKLHKDNELITLRKELNINNTKPLLLIAGCPDQTKNCPEGFEFSDMADFCRKFAQALRKLEDKYEIVVRPHPNFTDMGNMLAHEGFRTTMIDTARLVALSDAFIAFASATIRWAISCAVPTINYDVFHYDYDDYRDVDGVINIKFYNELLSTLDMFDPDNTEFDRLKAGISHSAPHWGMLDGRSTHRIANLIEGLCRLEHVPRTCY